MTRRKLNIETIAAHAGLRQSVADTVSTVAPIVASTTFTADTIEGVHEALGPDPHGFAYSRNGNPTVVALETAIAALENTDDAVAFGSGMGAIQATFMAIGLAPGDVIVSGGDLYGITRSLFTFLEDQEIQTQYVDTLNLDAVDSAVAQTNARVLYFESISNPLLRVADVAELSRIGKRHNVTVLLDNTFASPYLLRAADLGVDVVIHSATKYIGGHGDVMSGVVAANASWSNRIRFARTVSGGVLSPFEAWLTLRGIRTLPLRMDRHSENAMAVALWLQDQPWIDHVYYPGLSSNPQKELAGAQFSGKFGGMLAFDVTGGRKEALALIDALQLITPGTSLGDVESLVLYPALSSHRTLDSAGLEGAGIKEGLVRFSVGIESKNDLIEDLDRAAGIAGLKESHQRVSASR
jgi:cystathionine beta-lyase/cystathionine gamma-synthase